MRLPEELRGLETVIRERFAKRVRYSREMRPLDTPFDEFMGDLKFATVNLGDSTCSSIAVRIPNTGIPALNRVDI